MIVKALGTTNTTIYSSTEISLINFFTPFMSVQSLHDCHYTTELRMEESSHSGKYLAIAQVCLFFIFHCKVIKNPEIANCVKI